MDKYSRSVPIHTRDIAGVVSAAVRECMAFNLEIREAIWISAEYALKTGVVMGYGAAMKDLNGQDQHHNSRNSDKNAKPQALGERLNMHKKSPQEFAKRIFSE